MGVGFNEAEAFNASEIGDCPQDSRRGADRFNEAEAFNASEIAVEDLVAAAED